MIDTATKMPAFIIASCWLLNLCETTIRAAKTQMFRNRVIDQVTLALLQGVPTHLQNPISRVG
jgi:hypothetical protein